MHERREQADAYGYTERINCGVVTLNLFREDALRQNLPLDNNHVVDLANATFPEHHLSPLQQSGIEILPGTDRCSAELFGYVSFASSENWRGQ